MSKGEFLRMGAGIAGGLLALGMYLSPIPTFKRILKKKTTEGFSAIPYGISLFNCLIYVFYSTPFVSEEWRNMVVLLVNGIGLLFNAAYVFIYLLYAPPSSKMAMQRLLAGVVTVFATVLVTSVMAVHDRKHRVVLVGTIGMVATISLYASPFSVLKSVLKTKSVEFLPIWLPIFATLCSAFWLAYGALSKDLIIMLPNFLGISLGCAQIVLYLCFRNNNNNNVSHKDVDMEKQKTKDKSSPDGDADAEGYAGNDDKAIQITVFSQNHQQKPNPINNDNAMKEEALP